MLTHGGVGKRRVPLTKVQTFTFVREGEQWLCAAFQNTKQNRLFVRLHEHAS